MGIFNFGGILDAIFPAKTKQIKYDQLLSQQQDEATKQLGANRVLNQADLAKFNAGASSAYSKLLGLEDEDMKTFGGLIDTQKASDPEALRARLAQSNFDIFGKYAKTVGDQSTLNDKLKLAKLGYGETGPSSYTSTLITDRTIKSLAPVLASMMANLGSDVNSIEGNRRLDYGQVADLISGRAGIPTRGLPLLMAPITARDGVEAADLSMIGQGIGNAKANTAGFKEQKNKWAAAAGAIDNSLNSALDTALSLYTGGLGGSSGLMGKFSSLLGSSGGRFTDYQSPYFDRAINYGRGAYLTA